MSDVADGLLVALGITAAVVLTGLLLRFTEPSVEGSPLQQQPDAKPEVVRAE